MRMGIRARLKVKVKMWGGQLILNLRTYSFCTMRAGDGHLGGGLVARCEQSIECFTGRILTLTLTLNLLRWVLLDPCRTACH